MSGAENEVYLLVEDDVYLPCLCGVCLSVTRIDFQSLTVVSSVTLPLICLTD